MTGTSDSTLLALLLPAAFTLRAAYRIHLGSSDFWTNGYSLFYEIAKNIAHGRGLWAGAYAIRPPVYPAFLAITAAMGGNYLWAVIPQALFGTGTAFCAFLIGKELFGRRTGLIACLLSAIYPYYVVHDTALQETAMLTFAAACSVWLLLRAQSRPSFAYALGAGTMLAVTVLIRMTMLPFALLAVPWLALSAEGPRRLIRAMLVLLPIVALVGAWMMRNDLVLGRPLLSSDAGYQFWLAHNPYTFSRYPAESIDRSRDVAITFLPQEELARVSHDELARNDWFLGLGLDYVRANPGASLTGALRKIAAGFSLVLNPEHGAVAQWAYALSYGPVLLLGIIGMALARRDWRRQSIIYAMILSFVIITGAFWAHTNHRMHLDVYLIVFASFAADRLFSRATPGLIARLWPSFTRPATSKFRRQTG